MKLHGKAQEFVKKIFKKFFLLKKKVLKEYK